MTYIPKSLTNNNLFTNGGEFIDSTGKPYSGYYHQLFDGKIYSGKTPLEPTKRLLTTIPRDELSNQVPNTPNNFSVSISKSLSRGFIPSFVYNRLIPSRSCNSVSSEKANSNQERNTKLKS